MLSCVIVFSYIENIKQRRYLRVYCLVGTFTMSVVLNQRWRIGVSLLLFTSKQSSAGPGILRSYIVQDSSTPDVLSPVLSGRWVRNLTHCCVDLC